MIFPSFEFTVSMSHAAHLFSGLFLVFERI